MKAVRSLMLGTAFAVAMTGLGGLAPAAADTFKLTAGSSHPPIVPWSRAMRDLVVPEATKRAKELGHEIEWVEAYSGVLYNFENTLEGVEDGLADIGWVGTLWEPIKMPLHNITFFAPFGSTNVSNLTDIAWELYEKVPALTDVWGKHNQVMLGPFVNDNYVVVSKTPIETFADLDGKRLYTPGPVARWVEGTGAIGVQGGLPIYYNGIQTGVTDGGILPTTAVLPFKLFEAGPYITLMQFGGSITGALTMNKDTWDSLPPEMQEMFKDVGKLYSDWVQTEVDKEYQAAIETLKANPDVTLIEMPLEEQKKWAAAVPNIAGEWVKESEAQGLPAGEVLKVFMEGTRTRGETPLRDWDKE